MLCKKQETVRTNLSDLQTSKKMFHTFRIMSNHLKVEEYVSGSSEVTYSFKNFVRGTFRTNVIDF